MDMDLLQWSRHFRNFPGQGDLPVDAFMEAVLATGYDGWLCLEIFNDRFRMALAAADRRGRRALADLARRPGAARRACRRAARPRRWSGSSSRSSEDDASALTALFAGLGFRLTGRHRSKQVARWTQGAINLVINTEPEGLAHSHQIVHGPSVVALGLRVGDAAAAMARAEALRIRPSASRSGRASSTSRRSAASAAR